MTLTFCYVGDLEDPAFDWDDPESKRFRTGNLPRRIAPVKKGVPLNLSIQTIWTMIREKQFEGRQIDWSGWAVKMTGAQLCELLKNEPCFNTEIVILEPTKVYLLVGAEDAWTY